MASDREALKRLKECVAEIWLAHRVVTSDTYNLCEKEECAWCQHTREDLTTLEAALAAPPSATHDYAALANRLADFRFGSVLKPDGTERDPKEWLAFEPELMRALRDLAATPAVEDIIEIDEDGKVRATGPHSALDIRDLAAPPSAQSLPTTSEIPLSEKLRRLKLVAHLLDAEQVKAVDDAIAVCKEAEA